MDKITPRFLEDSAVFQNAIAELEEQNHTGTFINMSSVDVPDGVNSIQTIGHTLPGVGEALYVYDSTIGFTQASANPLSIFITSNGRGFRLAEDNISVLMLGARGDGVTDDTASFNAAIDLGKKVNVPQTPNGYVVRNIKVVDNMYICGEKNGMSTGPKLIITQTDCAAFYNNSGSDRFHCTFENLVCAAAPGVEKTYFYRQSDLKRYSAYFTFKNIETYVSLKAGYVGLFIFAIWDRIRDGYLGTPIGDEHSGIIALAESYGQTNQQNINLIKDSMFFGAFGSGAGVVASYGVLWTFQNVDFEALKTPAVLAYNVFQIKFSYCWFEGVEANAVVDLRNYTGFNAASSAMFDHCNFVFNKPSKYAVSVQSPGTVSFNRNMFNLVNAGSRLCNDGKLVAFNQDNVVGASDGAADFMTGMHHDYYTNGYRMSNGAVDNLVPNMTVQNKGGLSSTAGFLSQANMRVATDFVTVAKSQTGLGAVVRISGYVNSGPSQGSKFSYVVDFQADDIKQVYPPRLPAGIAIAFVTDDDELKMKTSGESATVFTSVLH